MKLFKNKTILFLILSFLVAIPSFVKIIRPGFFPVQDIMQVFRSYEMNKCFVDFQLPCRWVPDGGYGYGYPQFNFYAPFAYYLGELFHLPGLQIIDSLKIVIGLGFVVGSLGMFLLVNEFFGGIAGLTASVLYTYLPYRAQEIYVRGDISEFWATTFSPLILWAVYKLIKTGQKKYIFITTVTIAGLFFSHVLFSFLFIPLIVFWTGFWLIFEKKIKTSPKVILTILLGLALSASFILPMLLEKKFVHIETLLGGYFDYRQHFVTIRELFLSNHWGYGSSALGPVDDLSLSTGIVQWILGVVAIVIALIKLRRDKKTSLLILSLGLISVFLLFLTHQKSAFIWSTIPSLAFLQFPWRLLAFSGLILSFLAGYSIYALDKFKNITAILAVSAVLFLNINFFTPKSWMNVSDDYYLAGSVWQGELTASIFDYLPIFAKLPPPSEAPKTPEILKGHAEFTNYFKGSDYQTGYLKVSDRARIRLPLFDFPGMTVYLNGKKVSHVNNDCSREPFCMGLITFDAPVGNFNFKVKLENTPVRTVGNIISFSSLICLGLWLIRKNEKILKK